jgi:hypothetical protein
MRGSFPFRQWRSLEASTWYCRACSTPFGKKGTCATHLIRNEGEQEQAGEGQEDERQEQDPERHAIHEPDTRQISADGHKEEAHLHL